MLLSRLAYIIALLISPIVGRVAHGAYLGAALTSRLWHCQFIVSACALSADMQSTAQSFGRITCLLRNAAASVVEIPLIHSRGTSASCLNSATCSCFYTIGCSAANTTSRVSLTLPSLGTYAAVHTSTPKSQQAVQSATVSSASLTQL